MAKDNRCVVVVPIYAPEPSADEVLALRSLQLLGGRYPIAFAAPEGLPLAAYLKWVPCAKVQPFAPKHFASVEAYSKLTASPGFYLRFARHQYMLLVQTDACLLHGNLEPWLQAGYSYLGAPWAQAAWLPGVQAYAQKRWGLPADRRVPAVGNGGASLRRIGHFLRAWLWYAAHGPKEADWLAAHRQEDVFWTQVLAPALPFFTLPDAQTAAAFAMETQLPTEGQALPLVVHAIGKYNPSFWLPLVEAALAQPRP